MQLTKVISASLTLQIILQGLLHMKQNRHHTFGFWMINLTRWLYLSHKEKDTTPLFISIAGRERKRHTHTQFEIITFSWKCAYYVYLYFHLRLFVLASDLNEETTEHAYVNVLTRGDLSSLRWISSPLGKNVSCSPKVQRCRIYYSSLNFRDIMLATGKLPPDAIPGKAICQKHCCYNCERIWCLKLN